MRTWKIDTPLTEGLSPFRESFNHFKNSWDGAAGKSSTLGVAEGLGAVVGLDVLGPLARWAEGPAALKLRTVGRLGVAAVTVAFPVAPTVVHALPAD